MAEPVPASAIVLAGGRSSRFGSDKLAAEIDGAPLLHHALRAVVIVCREVLVVGAPSGLPVEPPPELASTTLLDGDAYPGPLVALVHATRSATHERLLLVGGDMPSLVPDVLRRLLVWGPEVEGCCLVSDGWVQPLPSGLDRAAVLEHGAALVDAGLRSLRSLIDAFTIELVLEDEWRAFDPEGRTLRDVDYPGDASRSHAAGVYLRDAKTRDRPR